MVTEIRRGPSDIGYRILREKNWKLIENLQGEKQLYNINDDPMEKVVLADKEPELAAQMSDKLASWVKAHIGEDGQDPIKVWPYVKKEKKNK